MLENYVIAYRRNVKILQINGIQHWNSYNLCGKEMQRTSIMLLAVKWEVGYKILGRRQMNLQINCI